LSIRFIDKPIHFFLDIDPKLPQVLVGDEIRIRQIIINLISNALKFTKAGFVRLSMKGIQANDRLLLYVSVQDTGQGIKENDRKNLFGVFGPVDTRSTEGTGVGLAISRNFVQMMNGTIYVDTVWGKGSTFSFVVPQEFGTSRTPLVQINRNDEGQHRVAILETGHELSDQWAIPMRQLKIDFKITSKPIEFVTMLHTNNFSHYLIAEELYEKMKDDLSRVTVNLIIIIKQNTRINSDFELPYLRRPVYSQTLYTALNGGEINVESAACQKQFTAPTALILVVDNNEMNIKTAEGLLECYGCQVIGASSGMEAIKAMQEQYVDLVIMDHMMPEMDGVETTKKIRALSGEYYDSVPIIAVTTNAVADGQEILREICYNDFLAKPIEPARLANVLIKWLPANKIITTKHQTENADVESPNVPQANVNFSRGWDAKNPNTRSGSVKTFNLLDSRTGLRYVGNEKGMYLSLLIDFIAISSEILQKIMALYEAKDWKNYAIETHALKSIARTFGALPLSEASKEMEHASKEGNETLITEMFDHYVAVFTETVQHITDYVEANKNEKK
jgi:CheY-like chemotaxis protein/HPt (histidine-containing phosphotransfer) domain-containing protein